MCLAVPAEVLEVNGLVAKVSVDGVQREVDVRLVPDIEPGDYILLHAGMAIQKYDKEEARKTLDLLREISDESSE